MCDDRKSMVGLDKFLQKVFFFSVWSAKVNYCLGFLNLFPLHFPLFLTVWVKVVKWLVIILNVHMLQGRTVKYLRRDKNIFDGYILNFQKLSVKGQLHHVREKKASSFSTISLAFLDRFL